MASCAATGLHLQSDPLPARHTRPRRQGSSLPGGQQAPAQLPARSTGWAHRDRRADGFRRVSAASWRWPSRRSRVCPPGSPASSRPPPRLPRALAASAAPPGSRTSSSSTRYSRTSSNSTRYSRTSSNSTRHSRTRYSRARCSRTRYSSIQPSVVTSSEGLRDWSHAAGVPVRSSRRNATWRRSARRLASARFTGCATAPAPPINHYVRYIPLHTHQPRSSTTFHSLLLPRLCCCCFHCSDHATAPEGLKLMRPLQCVTPPQAGEAITVRYTASSW